MSGGDLHIKNLRGADGAPVEVLVRGGRIAAMGAHVDGDVDFIDGGGDLILPALVDSHLHLDKSLAGLPWYPHAAGPERKPHSDGKGDARRTAAFRRGARGKPD